MRRLRSRAFIWVVPLVLGLGLALPVALADVYTTASNKTLGGSFTGGTVPNATTFSSPVTFNAAGNLFAGFVNFNGNISIAGNFGGAVAVVLPDNTALTPDAPTLLTPQTISNSWHVLENADSGFDFQNCSAGSGIATDPTFCIHSHNQNTTQWIDFKHDGTSGVIATGTGSLVFANGTAININNHSNDFTTAGNLQMFNTGQVSWSSTGAANGSNDVGLTRTAAGVLKVTNASSGSGWIQQPSSDLALNGNYTNSTATFSNTNLSASLISGRTYSFSLVLLFDESTVADGVQIDFNGGGATVTDFRVHCIDIANNGVPEALVAATSTTLAGVINDTAMAVSNQYELRCDGTIVPSSTGTFTVRAAQNTHSTGTLTIRRGSWLQIRDANPL